MRVLSPKILPLESELLGSIAKIATFSSLLRIYFPRDSIKVLFPTPGIPVMAILFEVLETGNKLMICCANF